MLDGKKGAFILKAASISPVPPKGMMSESPLDEEEMAQAMAKAVSDAGIQAKLVNVALPENQVYTKVLDMPVLSDRELASAIYWEAEQYIPVPLTSITLVWNVLKRPANATQGDKMQVLMVGAPTMLVNKYQKIISMAGFQINSMETEILAALRSLVLDESFPTSLVVNIGAISTSFAIVREGAMVFTYSMSVGGAAINRAIATDFGLTSQQAEEYKRVYGISGKSLGGKIGKATEPILSTILGEIKKSIAFYSQKYKDDLPIRQIILSGGTAKLPGIEIFFANNSGIEAAIANPWKVLASQQMPKEILDNASDYTIAVGLAMKDYE
jgi:type IV pilus assembly protein PilM